MLLFGPIVANALLIFEVDTAMADLFWASKEDLAFDGTFIDFACESAAAKLLLRRFEGRAIVVASAAPRTASKSRFERAKGFFAAGVGERIPRSIGWEGKGGGLEVDLSLAVFEIPVVGSIVDRLTGLFVVDAAPPSFSFSGLAGRRVVFT
jgi:hypothetical protein